MKNIFKSLCSRLSGKKAFCVYGEQGGIATRITLPDNFDTAGDRCHMVVLMHGFMASMGSNPIPALAKALAKEGIASISFDFNAHGKSEGRFIDMTIANEISDAKAVTDYARSLPYVSGVSFVGHSQGGVIAGMLAGQLEESADKPTCVTLLAPAAVLKDDAIAGRCMGMKYNPENPPEYVNVWMHKLGRKFILAAQKLPIYETSCKYSGPVCLIHGKQDKIVPYSYSERYQKTYPNAVLHMLEDEGHFMRKQIDSICGTVVSFVKGNIL